MQVWNQSNLIASVSGSSLSSTLLSTASICNSLDLDIIVIYVIVNRICDLLDLDSLTRIGLFEVNAHWHFRCHRPSLRVDNRMCSTAAWKSASARPM